MERLIPVKFQIGDTVKNKNTHKEYVVYTILSLRNLSIKELETDKYAISNVYYLFSVDNIHKEISISSRDEEDYELVSHNVVANIVYEKIQNNLKKIQEDSKKHDASIIIAS